MSVVVRMPEVATGATEAAIQSWLVTVGDEVATGQALVEIETEKAVVEYEAEATGIVAALLLDPGANVSVGTPIAILAAPGESAAEAIASAGLTTPAPVPTPAPPAPTAFPVPSVPSVPSAVDAPVPAITELSASLAAASPVRLFASPLVRRLARDRGIDLTAVVGSGPNGRVVRRDIDDLSPVDVPIVEPVPSGPTASIPTGYTDLPHTRMRRAIARRLTESSSTVPHFFLTADCVVDELLELRSRIAQSAGVKVSVNDFVLKAVAAAMREVPDANVIWTDDATRRFDTVDIAVAVSIPGGLVTPVVRDVGTLPLGKIAATVRDLADRARDGRLAQGELEGGSFSVSNLGMFGTKEFTAIINPPHAGILAVGAAQRRPVVVDDELAIASIMTVTLSADHRVLDGALAAQWLSSFVHQIEHPLGLLV